MIDVQLPTTHVPGKYYSSTEFYDAEVQQCFLKDWLFAARVEEVEHAGDYVARHIVRQPFIIARDRAGKIHAYYNMCLHRGVEVATGEGNTPAFSCPYHGWSYDLSGKLTGAPYMKDTAGFDLDGCRMKPLRLGEWAGNIFVSFNDDPQPFDEFIADFAFEFDCLQMQDCKFGNRIAFDLDCNWKLTVENLMDYYHLGVLHSKTIGNRVKWSTHDVRLFDDGGYRMSYSGKPSTPGGKAVLDPMPWLREKDGFAIAGCLPPHVTVFGRADCIKLYAALPLGPDKCRVQLYHLFPKEYFDRPDFQDCMKVYREYNIAVFEEDRSMIESLQRASALDAFVPGPMAQAERQISHYINTHVRKVLSI
jgi:choline monooxygenase